MELIEVSEQGFLPVSTALGGRQNLILQQGFRPTHFINDAANGGDTYELIEEFPATGLDGQASFVQVMEPSPTVIVNYVIGANGSLIPIYDSLPIDNTVTIVTGAAEPVSEVTVPSHILDHMYARKPKEPGSETVTKPRKRVKKKEPPPRVANNDYAIPEIISTNTTKVNIIRKGQTINTPPPQTTFRQMLSSRPKILQTTKNIATSPQRVVASSISDLSSTPQPIPTRTLTASSVSPSSIATSPSNDPIRLDLNDSHSRPAVPATVPKQTPSIYFLPPRANPSDVSSIIGSTVAGTESTKTSFIVSTEEEEGEGRQAKEVCLVLPSTSSSFPASPLAKTDVDGQQQHHQTGEVQTFQLNSDGTITAISSTVDETTESGNPEVHEHAQSEMYSEFSISPFSEEMAESDEAVVRESANGGSFQIGDKKIYFSYG